MKICSSTQPSLCALFLLWPSVIDSLAYDCEKIIAEGAEFRLGKLGGIHQVANLEDRGSAIAKTTFKIDICKALTYSDDEEGQEERKSCKQGTQICAIETEKFPDGNTETTSIFPIARSDVHDGADLKPKRTRLKTSSSNADSEKEGLRLEIGGGKKYDGAAQTAIIEFICKRGNEKRRRSALSRSSAEDNDNDGGSGTDGDNDEEREAMRKTDDGQGGTLEFLSYNTNKLRLQWLTPWACEDAATNPPKPPSSGGDKDGEDGDEGQPSGGWGFFSWFFFLLFMGILAYFGVSMWINYTRYGAHGWDLIPHSDTIRDIPYILGDWGRKIIGTLSGGGSRGGYSAV